MKLASFQRDAEVRLGALNGDGSKIIDLAAAAGRKSAPFASRLTLIQAGEAGLEQARQTLAQAEDSAADGVVLPLDGLRLVAPLTPPRMLCFSVYDRHVKQAFESAITLRAGKTVGALAKRMNLVRLPKSFYAKPLYYKGNNLSVIGHDEDVIWPRWTEMMDYELELGVVLGKAGKNIDENDAMAYVFGYTCFNDFSARDVMMREIPRGVGPIKGKDFDTGNAMGPWIVTADEIPDPYDLRMQVRVNGELRGESSTSLMSHPISKMIAVASDEERVVPGEFFGTGAAPDGCGIESLRFLAPGDLVEIEIDGIGILRNRVVRAS